MNPEYRFKASVRSACAIMGGLLVLLILTIPFAVYLFWRRAAARLTLDDHGLSVSGLGPGTQRWDYAQLDRIGELRVTIGGAGPGVALGTKLNGGRTAVNLVAKTKKGKTLKFMVSRFDQADAIIAHLMQHTGLQLESLSMGAMGPKWP